MSYRTDENGNYVRTVRCGHCYEIGHNKSGCKDRKEKLVNTIAQYERKVAEDDFDDDWDRRYVNRWLENNKAQLEKMNNRGKNRKCSYCTGYGHNRRSCGYKKGDMNDFAAKALVAREKFADRFTEVGLGIGTLGHAYSWRKCDRSTLAMIDRIDWHRITHESALGENLEYNEIIYAKSITPTENYPEGERFSNMLTPDLININNIEVNPRTRNKERGFEVISPVDPSFPDDFLTMKGCHNAAIERGIFEKERPYDYYGVEYDDE